MLPQAKSRTRTFKGEEKMTSIVGVIFSSINEDNVPELTKLRSMGSIPYGGRYRLVDFPLSNMVNSGITTVGMITKNNYQLIGIKIISLNSGA